MDDQDIHDQDSTANRACNIPGYESVNDFAKVWILNYELSYFNEAGLLDFTKGPCALLILELNLDNHAWLINESTPESASTI